MQHREHLSTGGRLAVPCRALSAHTQCDGVHKSPHYANCACISKLALVLVQHSGSSRSTRQCWVKELSNPVDIVGLHQLYVGLSINVASLVPPRSQEAKHGPSLTPFCDSSERGTG